TTTNAGWGGWNSGWGGWNGGWGGWGWGPSVGVGFGGGWGSPGLYAYSPRFVGVGFGGGCSRNPLLWGWEAKNENILGGPSGVIAPAITPFFCLLLKPRLTSIKRAPV